MTVKHGVNKITPLPSDGKSVTVNSITLRSEQLKHLKKQDYFSIGNSGVKVNIKRKAMLLDS